MKVYLLPIVALLILVGLRPDDDVMAGAYEVDCTPKCCRKDYCMDRMRVEIINNGETTVKQVNLRVIVNDVMNDRIVYNEVHTLKVSVPPNNSRPTAWFTLKRKVISESMAIELSVESSS